MIRSTPSERREAIIALAKDQRLLRDIKAYVLKNSGDQDDATMVFNDSIIVFVKKVFSDRAFNVDSGYQAYIYGIAKNLWLGKLRKAKKNPIYHENDDNFETVESQSENNLFSEEKSVILHEVMSHLRSNCKEVLMYWAGGYSMKEIAQLLGYKSDGMVRKKKCECYKELIKWLDAHPTFKEELKNLL